MEGEDRIGEERRGAKSNIPLQEWNFSPFQ
jgi:hypothetical protein